jgi:hypothetical protein
VEYGGETRKIGFNACYIIDALPALATLEPGPWTFETLIREGGGR